VYAGRYSVVGRPNITSVLHLLNDPAEVIEANREGLKKIFDEDPVMQRWRRET
jgi:hypothetical protein